MSASDSKVLRVLRLSRISLRGLQLLNFLQGSGRVGSLSKLLVSQPQLIVGFEMLWIEFCGFRQASHGLHICPRRRRQLPQLVMCIRQFRFERQSLPELLRSLNRLSQLQKIHAFLSVSEPISAGFRLSAREKARRAFQAGPGRRYSSPSAANFWAARVPAAVPVETALRLKQNCLNLANSSRHPEQSSRSVGLVAGVPAAHSGLRNGCHSC